MFSGLICRIYFLLFCPFSQKNLRRFFARRRFACFCYFSIFFSKCKQFSFICVNEMFNNKMNYSERKIIKIIFSKIMFT